MKLKQLVPKYFSITDRICNIIIKWDAQRYEVPRDEYLYVKHGNKIFKVSIGVEECVGRNISKEVYVIEE